MNSGDQAGTIMAALVWLLMLYSVLTVTLLTITEGIPAIFGMIHVMLCFLALASHAKTSFTDPGSVPRAAVPCEAQRQTQQSHSMCGQCQTYKPPASHHCRICNRCVSKMDHHCPWMNNCVGAGNLSEYFGGLLLAVFNDLHIVSSRFFCRALYTISHLHMGMCWLRIGSLWLELFFLRRWRLHIPSRRPSFGESHDAAMHWCLSLYQLHVDECMLWNHDGHWHHWSVKEKGHQHYEC